MFFSILSHLRCFQQGSMEGFDFLDLQGKRLGNCTTADPPSWKMVYFLFFLLGFSRELSVTATRESMPLFVALLANTSSMVSSLFVLIPNPASSALSLSNSMITTLSICVMQDKDCLFTLQDVLEPICHVICKEHSFKWGWMEKNGETRLTCNCAIKPVALFFPFYGTAEFVVLSCF